MHFQHHLVLNPHGSSLGRPLPTQPIPHSPFSHHHSAHTSLLWCGNSQTNQEGSSDGGCASGVTTRGTCKPHVFLGSDRSCHCAQSVVNWRDLRNAGTRFGRMERFTAWSEANDATNPWIRLYRRTRMHTWQGSNGKYPSIQISLSLVAREAECEGKSFPDRPRQRPNPPPRI